MPTDDVELYAGWKAVINGKEYGNRILLNGDPEKDAEALKALRENLEESLRKIKDGIF